MSSLLILFLTACTSTFSEVEAESTYQIPTKAIKNNPKAASYNVQLGVAYLQQGDVERAKSKLQMAMKQDPNSSSVLDGMGYFWELTGEPKLAETYYQKAITVAKQKGDPHNNYGTFLCRQGSYKEAIKYFLLAAQDPTYNSPAQAYENAGLCAMQIPDRKEAEKYFKTALKKQPGLSNAILELGKINFENGEYQASQHYINQYLVNAKPSAESLWLSMRLAQKLGDEQTAAYNAELLKKDFASSKEYHDYLKNENLS